MPLTSSSPVVLHILQNVSLITLAIAFAPLVTLISLTGHLVSSHTIAGRAAKNDREKVLLSKDHTTRTVLVTGVAMSKGLAIARAFYRQGHTVIAADFEPYRVLVCGRFSNAIHRFYRLSRTKQGGSEVDGEYVEQILDIIAREKVHLWISCSGVSSAVDDAFAAETVERNTPCKAIQFGVELTKVLHEKHTFIQQCQDFGLRVPTTQLIQNIEQGMRYFYPRWAPHMPQQETASNLRREYILKPVGVEDSRRADMTLLPLERTSKTIDHLWRLDPSPSRPFVIQKFIKGSEYCTHSLIVRGQVKAFTACPSAELLMHYQALSPDSFLFKEMLRFTQVYAGRLGANATGHFSIDFMVDDTWPEGSMRERMYPIECNPRAHTAVVLFDQVGMEMVNAYLSVLGEDASSAMALANGGVVVPDVGIGYYWVGHDLIARMLLPVLNVFRLRTGPGPLIRSWREFANHVSNWKDGTFEVWDPWPFWALYCVYWPSMFLMAILTRSWWSRCNVSTTKMFRC